MTIAEIQAWFEEESEAEFLEFERIEAPRHRRPDMCAFLMLDEIQPGDRDMVSDARHDEVYLDFDVDAAADKLTPEILRDLSRCGVRYDEGSFCMFV